MPGLMVLVSNVNQTEAPAGQYRLAFVGEVEGSAVQIGGNVFVNYTDSVPVINLAVLDAAVAAAAVAGFTVLPADKKTLYGGAGL